MNIAVSNTLDVFYSSFSSLLLTRPIPGAFFELRLLLMMAFIYVAVIGLFVVGLRMFLRGVGKL